MRAPLPQAMPSSPITWLVLRRMRTPLIVLICAYAISVLGLTLVPGIDPEGNPDHLSFFHAFYVISYISTTIGFGELPHPFTEAQRLWVIISIYLTVIAWLYAIGSILTLLQDRAFQQAIVEQRFVRAVRRIREPFHLVAGYGQASTALIDTLTDFLIPVVVIDRDPERIAELTLNDQNYHVYVPGLLGDACDPRTLLEAGLLHPYCSRVIALTDDDRVNLKVAITSKLINPEVKVICCADHADVIENLKSFGTEYIFDPFEIFCDRLALALHSPHVYLLHDWLGSEPGREYQPPKAPQRGEWIVVGYGRFGRKMCQRLEAEGLKTTVIEINPDEDAPLDVVVGRGTEAETLRQAHIEQAVGIIAGTDDDVNNLSIIMTAREINPGLYTVARQNHQTNEPLFLSLQADLVMNPHRVLANHVRTLLTSPRLFEYFEQTRNQPNSWGWVQISRLYEVQERGRVPDVWSFHVDQRDTPALAEALAEGERFTLETIMRDPYRPEMPLRCHALAMWREGEMELSPHLDTELRLGDVVLFSGVRSAYRHMHYLVNNREAIEYLRRGSRGWESPLLRWLGRHSA